MSDGQQAPGRASARGKFGWCLYDWANSAFPTVISTFVFATYFTRELAPDETTGTVWWGWASALTALLAAIGAPVLGAIADRSGGRKPWIVAFSLLNAAGCALLFFAAPGLDWTLWALFWVVAASLAFEYAQVFYNAMLKELAAPGEVGRLSGWGQGLGYAGALVCLIVALKLFVQNPAISHEAAFNVRATTLLTAGWLLVFTVPLLLWTPDRPSTSISAAAAVQAGLGQLVASLKRLRHRREVVVYLIASMLYTDGLTTLFTFGGIYAAGTFGLSFEQILLFGILLNITAGIGAAAFAWVDDAIGPKKTILLSLVFLTLLGTALLLVSDAFWFWILGAGLGIFVGPAQAASRTLMAYLAPAEEAGEMFGLFALSGKATAFLGPLLVGSLTAAFHSQRAGMSIVVIFFVIGGLLLLLGVPDRRGRAAG
jgi:UMF1 family MFS transporter